jgi:hypothetical protein
MERYTRPELDTDASHHTKTNKTIPSIAITNKTAVNEMTTTRDPSLPQDGAAAAPQPTTLNLDVTNLSLKQV